MDTIANSGALAAQCKPYNDPGATKPAPMTIDRKTDNLYREITGREPKKSSAVDEMTAAIRRAKGDDARHGGNYNYGAPLKIASDDKLFADGTALCNALRTIQHDAGDRHWRIEMALRDYCHACTSSERTAAAAKLNIAIDELAHFAPTTGGDPTPNYTFIELAAIGRATVDAIEHIHPEARDYHHYHEIGHLPAYTGQPSPGAAVTLPPLTVYQLDAASAGEREAHSAQSVWDMMADACADAPAGGNAF